MFLFGVKGTLEINLCSSTEYLKCIWDSLMILGGINIAGCTDLHIIRNDKLMIQRYADVILRPHIVPFVEAINSCYFLSMHGNAILHAALLVENMFEKQTIQRRECSTCSCDWNLITCAWDTRERCIAARASKSQTVNGANSPLTVWDLDVRKQSPETIWKNSLNSMGKKLYISDSFRTIVPIH